MRRPRRPRSSQNGQSLSRLLAADDDTVTFTSPDAGRYQTAPVGPAPPRRIGGRGWTATVNTDIPASAADHMDDRCRAAHAYLKLEVDDLKAQGMLYRVDDAEQVRERGETLDERSVIALAVAKATRHLLGPREPWQPGPYTPPQPDRPAYAELAEGPWYHPQDPSGVRAAYDRAFNGGDAA